MKIGPIDLTPPFALAPMAGMTDTAFRRLVKRRGGCGLVVSEMVSSEGLVRGIDRTLEYAGVHRGRAAGLDPDLRRRSREDGRGRADRRRHGRRHRRRQHGMPGPEDREAQRRLQPDARARARGDVVRAMARAVRIPVTVKMRAGWDAEEINAPDLARRMEDAGAAAVAVHGRTAAQSYSGSSDWDLIARVAAGVCDSGLRQRRLRRARQLVERLRGGGVSGVLVGRGALRNPWIFEQARDRRGQARAR